MGQRDFCRCHIYDIISHVLWDNIARTHGCGRSSKFPTQSHQAEAATGLATSWIPQPGGHCWDLQTPTAMGSCYIIPQDVRDSQEWDKYTIPHGKSSTNFNAATEMNLANVHVNLNHVWSHLSKNTNYPGRKVDSIARIDLNTGLGSLQQRFDCQTRSCLILELVQIWWYCFLPIPPTS